MTVLFQSLGSRTPADGYPTNVKGGTSFALTQYLATYNHSIPQRALNIQTPIQALKTWRKTNPDLFVKNVYEHPSLDI